MREDESKKVAQIALGMHAHGGKARRCPKRTGLYRERRDHHPAEDPRSLYGKLGIMFGHGHRQMARARPMGQETITAMPYVQRGLKQTAAITERETLERPLECDMARRYDPAAYGARQPLAQMAAHGSWIQILQGGYAHIMQGRVQQQHLALACLLRPARRGIDGPGRRG